MEQQYIPKHYIRKFLTERSVSFGTLPKNNHMQPSGVRLTRGCRIESDVKTLSKINGT